MIEVIADRHEVKGRKEHKCFDCAGKIAKGEQHLTGTYKYDDIYTIRQHFACAKFADRLGPIFKDDQGGWPPMWDWEDGYLDESDHNERIAIMKKAGWLFLDKENANSPPKETNHE